MLHRRLGLVCVALAVACAAVLPVASAAAPPEVYSVAEGRDSTGANPIVIVFGKRLSKFKTFSLHPAGSEITLGAPVVTRASSSMLVLQLPGTLEPGAYEVHASDARGTEAEFATTVGNGRPLPGSVEDASLDSALRADLDDAATLGGHPASYFIDLASRQFIGAKVYLGAQWNTNNTGNDVAIGFDQEDFDTDGCHTNSAPTRLTANTAGYYAVEGKVTYTGNPVEGRIKRTKNGSLLEYSNQYYGAGGGIYVAEVRGVVRLEVGEYVELQFKDDAWPLREGLPYTKFSFVRLGE